MHLSRRNLLQTTAAIMWPGLGPELKEGEPFTLSLPEWPFDPTLPTYASVSTSGYTNCQVRVVDRKHELLQSSLDWGTEPNVPEAAQLKGSLPGTRPSLYATQIQMRPTRPKTPSVSLALTQSPALLLRPVSFQSANLQLLKNLAAAARFLEDPAHLPGGRFQANLSYDSSILLRIWGGEAARGEPVYQRKLLNRPSGSNEIPWNLHSSKGSLVPSGRYLATMVCQPMSAKVLPTLLMSYFAVITP